jgi:formate dehydrogenase major subunit
MLPTYLPQPNAFKPHTTLKEYLEHERTPTGWWHNFPKYAVSLLKAYYGDAARLDNDFGFGWVPRIVGDHSQLPMTLAMRDGVIRGMFMLGQNPAVGGHNAALVHRGLAKLDWLVVRDMTETETASFWYAGRPVRDGELHPRDIRTEVFLMPASLSVEKAGSVTNTHRLLQWHDKVVSGPGDRQPLRNLVHLSSWPPVEGALCRQHGSQGRRAQRIDLGVPDRRQGAGAFGRCGAQRDERLHLARAPPDREFSTAQRRWNDRLRRLALLRRLSRGSGQSRPGPPPRWSGRSGHAFGLGLGLARQAAHMYNRASADEQGRPWSERKRLMSWDTARGEWVGPDVVDFEPKKPPDYQPDWSKNPEGMEALGGDCPFIMIADGKASLFTPSGLKDAPVPAHYEPVESPVKNPLYRQQSSPVAKIWERPDNRLHAAADPRFPYALTTYRLTEHHAGGIPTRTVPVTAELQPEAFAEISPELADSLGINNLDWVTVSTLRGEVEVKALVTERVRPFRLDDQTVHEVGLIWHFGWEGFARGDIANILSAVVGDPNTSIHEAKAFTCDLRRGRREATR